MDWISIPSLICNKVVWVRLRVSMNLESLRFLGSENGTFIVASCQSLIWRRSQNNFTFFWYLLPSFSALFFSKSLSSSWASWVNSEDCQGHWTIFRLLSSSCLVSEQELVWLKRSSWPSGMLSKVSISVRFCKSWIWKILMSTDGPVGRKWRKVD